MVDEMSKMAFRAIKHSLVLSLEMSQILLPNGLEKCQKSRNCDAKF